MPIACIGACGSRRNSCRAKHFTTTRKRRYHSQLTRCASLSLPMSGAEIPSGLHSGVFLLQQKQSRTCVFFLLIHSCFLEFTRSFRGDRWKLNAISRAVKKGVAFLGEEREKREFVPARGLAVSDKRNKGRGLRSKGGCAFSSAPGEATDSR